MNAFHHSSVLVEQLQHALQCLPGVGPRTARRMCFHLLERDRAGAEKLCACLTQTLKQVVHCQRCGNFSQTSLCELCSSPHRNSKLLCVLETPADLESMERCNIFKGHYFLLMGRLSVVEKTGPEDIRIPVLLQRLAEEPPDEMVLAINTTADGDMTCDYLTRIAHNAGVRVTRLARGIPVGSELEYLDQATLREAFMGRFAQDVAD